MSQADVTVVVLSWNRCGSVLRTLRHLTALPEKPPVIVVDNGSADGTIAQVQTHFPQVITIALNENRGPSARNLGVEAAQTPYVAFADDDSWWQAGAISKAAQYFKRYPKVGLIAGRILVNTEERLDPVCAELARSGLPQRVPMPGPAIMGFLACGIIVRRDAFRQAGGFNARLGVGGEETLLAVDLARLGWGMTYCDDIVGHHYPSPVRDRARRERNVVRSELWFAWLRRPWRVAVPTTLHYLYKSTRYANVRQAVMEAFRGIGWALRERKVLPETVERDFEQLSPQK